MIIFPVHLSKNPFFPHGLQRQDKTDNNWSPGRGQVGICTLQGKPVRFGQVKINRDWKNEMMANLGKFFSSFSEHFVLFESSFLSTRGTQLYSPKNQVQK